MKKLLLSLVAVLCAFSFVSAEDVNITAAELTTDGQLKSDNYTLAFAKNSGQTAPAYYAKSNDIRVYAKGTVTVTAPAGIKMQQIVFKLSTQGKKRLAAITANVGAISSQKKGDETVTWTGDAEEVTLTVGDKNEYGTDSKGAGQLCFSSVVISVADSGNPDNITPVLTWSAKEATAVLGDNSFVAPTLTVGPTEKAEEIKTLVEYKSSDPKVATIDEKGQITLVGRGKTTITAFVEAYENYNAQEASYELTVTYTPTSLKWSAETVEVNIGDEFTAPTLTFDPEGLAVADNLAYSSSDPTVATIDAKTGAVEIIDAGTTVITASIKNVPGYEDAEASYTLTVVDKNAIVLTFIKNEGTSESVSSYVKTWERTLNDFTWSISNFNNNNNGWGFIKCGRKGNESVANITTASVMEYPVNEIVLTIDAITAAKVNSIKLLTSTSATDFTTAPIHSIDVDKSTGDKTINIPNPQANLYYCLEFNCASGSDNGLVQVSKVVYKLKTDNKESAELAYATTTVNKATTDQPFINPLTNEHGVEVVYRSDNEAVATVNSQTGEVTVVGVGQAVISAAFAGNEAYSRQTVSYTLNVSRGVNSVEETKALEVNTTAYINYPLTVAFVNGNQVFAVDEAGKFIQVFGTNSYAANDIIPAGWTGQFLYHGNTPEIQPVSALPEAVAGGSFVPAAVVDPTTITANMVNSVVLLKNAVINAATPTGKDNFNATIAGNTVNLRTNYMSTSASEGVYDITAVVNLYNNAVSLYAAGYKAVPAFRINDELVTTTTFDAKGLKIKLVAVLPEGHQMWYRFTPVAAASSQAVIDKDGFTKYEGAFELEDPGQLEYYSVDPDQNKSEVYALRLDNVTGINDIVVDGDNSEAVYYNLQGVRVDNPNTGIYLVRRAGRVSKVFVK